MKWLDLTPELTKEGQAKLKVGQILIFNKDGQPIHIKIMRKHKGKVWGKYTYIYLPEEVDITEKN